MPTETREVRPSSHPREVITADGARLAVPDHWDLLLPGDPALSRRIKKDGPSWTMIEMKGRKRFSRGIWAPAERIAVLEDELRLERQSPAYVKKLEAGRARREREHQIYAAEFEAAVFKFLDFAPEHADLAIALSNAVSDHAVPVGSGTVARTQSIPIEQRAEAAVIAWMRHQTTAYDHMTIPREKGKRREVRRMLASRSRELLQRYRVSGLVEKDQSCLLKESLGL